MSTNNQHPTLTGAEILWATLAGEGTTTIFGYPGGAILPIYDALRKFPTIHHVLVRHEQGASHMADGYARASVAASASAWPPPAPARRTSSRASPPPCSTRIPLIAITGQVSLEGSRLGRLSGSRHYRHHAAHHQAQLPRHARRRHRGYSTFGFSDCDEPAVPGPCSSTSPRTRSRLPPPFDFDMSKPPALHRPHPMLQAESSQAIKRSRRADQVREEARHPRRSRHRRVRRGTRSSSRFAEALQIPIASTLLGLGSHPRTRTRCSSA